MPKADGRTMCRYARCRSEGNHPAQGGGHTTTPDPDIGVVVFRRLHRATRGEGPISSICLALAGRIGRTADGPPPAQDIARCSTTVHLRSGVLSVPRPVP